MPRAAQVSEGANMVCQKCVYHGDWNFAHSGSQGAVVSHKLRLVDDLARARWMR